MKIHIYVKKMCNEIISLSPPFAAKAFLKAKKTKTKTNHYKTQKVKTVYMEH